jgi:hypothetical protein
MGRRAASCLLVVAIAGCGVHLGYDDDEVVDQFVDPTEDRPKSAVLDAQVVTPPSNETDASAVEPPPPIVDASVDVSPPTPPAPPSPLTKRVFVSSTSSNANLGGATGADARCQNLAQAAGLGGMFRAWLSVSGSSPSTRFTKAVVPYRLLDGTVVADDWNDLTDGTLKHAIDRDEKNALVVAAEVWTGTRTNGTLEAEGCLDFSTGDVFAPVASQGITDRAGTQWTAAYLQFCNRTSPRIYCFEQ